MDRHDAACQALAFIEQLISVAEQLKSIEDLMPIEGKAVFSAGLARLEAVIQALDTDVTLPIIQGEGKLAKLPFQSVITQLGIAGELIRQRSTGKVTVEALAAQYGISPATIRRFFQYYDAAAPSEKAKYRRQSVFDVTDRLEDLMQIIVRQMARLEGANDEVHVKYVGEFRQTLTLASQVIEKINNYQRFQQLIGLVADILADELPTRRREILQRIQTLTNSVVTLNLESKAISES